MRKRVCLSALCIMIVLALITGCAGNDQGQPEENGETLSEAKKAILEIGETAEVGDFVFTLNGARYATGYESWAPEDGEAWIVFDCNVENKGSEYIFVTSVAPDSNINLYGVDGNSKETTAFATAESNLSAEIEPAGKVSGVAAFVVSNDETEWEFIFSPHDDSGQAIYPIKASDIE